MWSLYWIKAFISKPKTCNGIIGIIGIGIIPWMFHRQVMMIKQPPCVVHKRNPGWWFIYGLYMVYTWFIYGLYIYINIYILLYIFIIYYIYIYIIYILYYIYILVGGFNQPLWKMMEWTSDGIMKFPTEWKVIKHVPNHQPEPEFLCDSTDF